MRRKEILEGLVELRRTVDPTEDLPDDIDEVLGSRLDEMKALSEQYIEQLPVVPVSRCPFSEVEHWHPIDVMGLDGPWWSYSASLRARVAMPGTHLALTGALRPELPVEYTGFLCMPGPEKPYVLPELLDDPNVKAVLSTVPVRDHEGYVIQYFAAERPDGLTGFNEWGSDHYSFKDENDDVWWNRIESEESFEHSFDLVPYIKRKKLLWIMPGDDELILQDTADNCPYLDLPGEERLQYIQYGERWFEEEDEPE